MQFFKPIIFWKLNPFFNEIFLLPACPAFDRDLKHRPFMDLFLESP